MNTIKFEDNPLFPQTTIFIGNGFDLSLGLKTRYTDFFNHVNEKGEKDFWPIHSSYSEDEQLYMRLNGRHHSTNGFKPTQETSWFDLEDELKKHAKRPSLQGKDIIYKYDESFLQDQKYFEEIRNGLMLYLKQEEKLWKEQRFMFASKSPAYQLMYEVCVQAKAYPNIITFNYTNIFELLDKCKDNFHEKIHINADKVQFVHGSLVKNHIILGINEDKDVPKEYDFLFKSWDEHYSSHQVIDTLKNSQIIFFFGLSFGSIDSVYFINFFNSIINGSYDNRKKHIVICTYNEKSRRDIYRQFFQMGISIMELKAHCDFNVLLTNPDNQEHPLKFENNKLSCWLREWNDVELDICE